MKLPHIYVTYMLQKNAKRMHSIIYLVRIGVTVCVLVFSAL